ncbi:MAG TPA: hypothetical protein VHY58_01165 [Streptosporangiaceae bacterium]|jgi:hypothetical protein|nr:hypothetical protein [Streptosporangiaceae bacterium]
MTTIDAGANIDIVWEGQRATVRIPLDGEVGQEWCRRYRALARRQNLTAWAESHPSRGWVIAELPEGADQPETMATLDTVKDLVSEADAAADPPNTEETDRVVQVWWAQQRG